MRRNGMQALGFQGPALVGGDLSYLHGGRYVNKVVALCFLPYPGHVAAKIINGQARRFSDLGAELLIVASGARPLHRLWIEQGERPLTPVLADPCGRLHRYFGVAVTEPAQRCHTFVIDRTGILRLRVSHDFIEHDLKVLQELIGASQRAAEGESAGDVDGWAVRASCLLA
ncbi:MAG: redoxin domain-containing protein [Nitrospira sp.]|nr:redoxin domain-containing protein [Nitrospira sp.]